MSKNIFLVVGLANSGKTQTIRNVYKALMHNEPPGDRDFHKRVTCKNIKIGFHSAGDSLACLIPIKEFKQADCDLLICACRTKGDTLNYFKKLQKSYTLYPILAFNETDPKYQKINNARVFAEIATKFSQLYNIALGQTKMYPSKRSLKSS